MRAILTPEERNEWKREYNRKYHANLSPEQKERHRERSRIRNRKVYANRTPEERARQREYKNKLNLCPERRKRNSLHAMQYRYGLTPETWEQLFDSQERRCAICRTDSAKNWHTDHCHKNKQVRGILCLNCNTGLGKFKDNPEALLRAISYLTGGYNSARR